MGNPDIQDICDALKNASTDGELTRALLSVSYYLADLSRAAERGEYDRFSIMATGAQQQLAPALVNIVIGKEKDQMEVALEFLRQIALINNSPDEVDALLKQLAPAGQKAPEKLGKLMEFAVLMREVQLKNGMPLKYLAALRSPDLWVLKAALGYMLGDKDSRALPELINVARAGGERGELASALIASLGSDAALLGGVMRASNAICTYSGTPQNILRLYVQFYAEALLASLAKGVEGTADLILSAVNTALRGIVAHEEGQPLERWERFADEALTRLRSAGISNTTDKEARELMQDGNIKTMTKLALGLLQTPTAKNRCPAENRAILRALVPLR